MRYGKTTRSGGFQTAELEQRRFGKRRSFDYFTGELAALD